MPEREPRGCGRAVQVPGAPGLDMHAQHVAHPLTTPALRVQPIKQRSQVAGVLDCMDAETFVARASALFDAAERLALDARDAAAGERVELARLPVLDIELPLVRALPEAGGTVTAEEQTREEYQRQVESAMAAEQVPLELREYVKGYFTGIIEQAGE